MKKFKGTFSLWKKKSFLVATGHVRNVKFKFSNALALDMNGECEGFCDMQTMISPS
jgi:hypothetical protein